VKVPFQGHFIDGKGLKAGEVGKTGTIGAICHKNATKFFKHNKPSGPWAGRGGTAQISYRSNGIEAFFPFCNLIREEPISISPRWLTAFFRKFANGSPFDRVARLNPRG
jgi:hypothetical protein